MQMILSQFYRHLRKGLKADLRLSKSVICAVALEKTEPCPYVNVVENGLRPCPEPALHGWTSS